MKQRWGRPVHPIGSDRPLSAAFVLVWLAGWIGLGGGLGYVAIASVVAPIALVETQMPPLAQNPAQRDVGHPSEGAPNKVGELPEGADDAARHPLPTLNGHHWLRTDLINTGAIGSASVSENSDGSYSIQGAQSHSSDLLTIDGTLWAENSRDLRFIGVIESQTKTGGGDIPCIRVGPLVFSAPEGQRYWRLIEPKNPCGNYTERIDLYFDGR